MTLPHAPRASSSRARSTSWSGKRCVMIGEGSSRPEVKQRAVFCQVANICRPVMPEMRASSVGGAVHGLYCLPGSARRSRGRQWSRTHARGDEPWPHSSAQHWHRPRDLSWTVAAPDRPLRDIRCLLVSSDGQWQDKSHANSACPYAESKLHCAHISLQYPGEVMKGVMYGMATL